MFVGLLTRVSEMITAGHLETCNPACRDLLANSDNNSDNSVCKLVKFTVVFRHYRLLLSYVFTYHFMVNKDVSLSFPLPTYCRKIEPSCFKNLGHSDILKPTERHCPWEDCYF